ncbi:MAG: DNA polymerase III subunit chi [Limnobacter sp.]|nr:DNA polymerase III subunit chi [Limnobacter sp.]
MTRIDFHLNVQDDLLYACRLIRKAWLSGLKIVCYATGLEKLKALDELLYTFSEEDFLPHALTGEERLDQAPIVLTNQVEDIRHYDLLINLDAECPAFFARFDRLVEIVGLDEQNKQQARERYRFYKDRGYPLNTFDRSQSRTGSSA